MSYVRSEPTNQAYDMPLSYFFMDSGWADVIPLFNQELKRVQ